MTLAQLINVELFAFFLIFLRCGGALMVMPTIGESFVNPTVRLTFAVFLSVLLTPTISPLLPSQPQHVSQLLPLFFHEILIGLFFGVFARILLSALTVLGTTFAFLGGFSNALLFNPTLSDQGVLQAVFFTMLGLLFIFVTDTHHLLLMAVAESYQAFPPGQPLILGDAAQVISKTVSLSFQVGVKLAAPFIIFSLMFYFMLGILSRLMPQLQVFFVAIPAQILLGVFLMFFSVSTIMLHFISIFRSQLQMTTL